MNLSRVEPLAELMPNLEKLHLEPDKMVTVNETEDWETACESSAACGEVGGFGKRD